MPQPFEPANDLERVLMAAPQHHLPVAASLQTLQASQIYIPGESATGSGTA